MDKFETPYYEIFFILQIIFAPIGCCMFIPFTNMIVAIMLFAILMCKVMQRKLRALKELNAQQALQEIVWCIKYQTELIK